MRWGYRLPYLSVYVIAPKVMHPKDQCQGHSNSLGDTHNPINIYDLVP